jgi:hypothetical protein
MVKNEYFGDRSDYFKYDLLLELLETMTFPGDLTFIPMLTAGDGSGDGGLTRYDCGTGRYGLYWFLQYCLGTKQRDVRQLRRFFISLPHAYRPYRDDHEKNGYFTHKDRAEYFDGIPGPALAHSLVFLDPDRGIEVKSARPSEAHMYVLYNELRSLIDRMGDGSVMVVFQYLSRFLRPADRSAYFLRIRQNLSERLRIPDPLCVADDRVAFFVAAKSTDRAARAREVVERYAERRSLIYSA